MLVAFIRTFSLDLWFRFGSSCRSSTRSYWLSYRVCCYSLVQSTWNYAQFERVFKVQLSYFRIIKLIVIIFFGMLQSTFGPLGAYWQRCFLIDQSFQGNIVITSIVGAWVAILLHYCSIYRPRPAQSHTKCRWHTISWRFAVYNEWKSKYECINVSILLLSSGKVLLASFTLQTEYSLDATVPQSRC